MWMLTPFFSQLSHRTFDTYIFFATQEQQRIAGGFLLIGFGYLFVLYLRILLQIMPKPRRSKNPDDDEAMDAYNEKLAIYQQEQADKSVKKSTSSKSSNYNFPVASKKDFQFIILKLQIISQTTRYARSFYVSITALSAWPCISCPSFIWSTAEGARHTL